MKVFIFVFIFVMLSMFCFGQSAQYKLLPKSELNFYYDDATALTINPAQLVNPEVGISRGKISFMANGVLTATATMGVSNEAVWDYATTTTAEVYPFWFSSAQTVYVNSSAAADASDGTGARTVVLEGLSSAYVSISETLNLDGATAQTTTNSFFRINNVYVATAGSGGINAGDIYVHKDPVAPSGVPSTQAYVYSKIPAGMGRVSNGFFTVPINKEMYIRAVTVMCGSDDLIAVSLCKKEYGGVMTRVLNGNVYRGEANLLAGKTPIFCDEKCDVVVKVDATSSAIVSINIEYDLLDE